MKIFLFAIVVFSALTHSAFASTRCYQIRIDEVAAIEDSLEGFRTENWCYQRLQSPKDGFFIYNIDNERIIPELAFIVDTDGNVLHSSMANGVRSVHRLFTSEYNPFSIPLFEPQMLSVSFITPTFDQSRSAEVVYEFLSEQAPASETRIFITEGELRASARVLPWRGYWWSFRSQRMDIPLAKYDSFVQARTGVSPNAAGKEGSTVHVYRGSSWGGHCNGWASSAIMRAEPRASKKDPISGVTFRVSDQKGLLAEKDYCAQVSFFGRRYNRSTDNLRDIDPKTFHQTITYYIGTLKKAVVMDRKRTAVVDNHIISSYVMKVTKLGTNRYRVVAKLGVHRYDSYRSESPGTASIYSKSYSYILQTSSSGAIVSGTWEESSDNPDFLWVPNSPTTCGSNNSAVTERYVQEILNL